MTRSDGKECTLPLWDENFAGILCPQCHTTNYGITTVGTIHNRVTCSCGWKGCECELLVKKEEVRQ